jgi:hypothetical protein
MRRRRRSTYGLGLALLVLTALVGLPALAHGQRGVWSTAWPINPAQDFIVEVKNQGKSQDLQSKNTDQSSPGSGGSGISLTVRAANARLLSVVVELQRQLKVPVRLSPLMLRQRVTVDFIDLPLEEGLQRLVPRPIVDYVVRGGLANQERLGIYLQAANEADPPLNSSFSNNSETIVIEGDTEGAAAIREPVWVSYVGNRLSLQARHQPLSYVLAQVASKVGVPFDLRSDTEEMIDIEFNHYTLEQAVRSLPASARLYVRNDFRGPEGKPLRIVSEKPN